jgi:ribosomal protein S18 acetylase RimI-like enzyme
VPPSAPDPPGYTLRAATPADALALARLHVETLPADQSDLTLLGERLVRHFYATALARGTAWVDVAEERGELLGLIVSTPDIGSMFPRTLLAGPHDVLAFLRHSSPVGLFRATIAKLTSGTLTVPSAPELVYVAVSPRARGRGLGRVLLHRGQLTLHRAGFTSYQTNTHADNEVTLRLLDERGFERVGEYEKSGRKLLHMVCRRSPPPPL